MRYKKENTAQELGTKYGFQDDYSVTGSIEGDIENYNMSVEQIASIMAKLESGQYVLYATGPTVFASKDLTYIEGDQDSEIPLINVVMNTLAERGGNFDPTLDKEQYLELQATYANDPGYGEGYNAILSSLEWDNKPVGSANMKNDEFEFSANDPAMSGGDVIYHGTDGDIGAYMALNDLDPDEITIEVAAMSDFQPEQQMYFDLEEREKAVNYFNKITGSSVPVELVNKLLGAKFERNRRTQMRSNRKYRAEARPFRSSIEYFVAYEDGNGYRVVLDSLDNPEDAWDFVEAQASDGSTYAVLAYEYEEGQWYQMSSPQADLDKVDMPNIQNDDGTPLDLKYESRRKNPLRKAVSRDGRRTESSRRSKMKSNRKYRAVAESKVLPLIRKNRGLRMVREDELEDGQFYIAVVPDTVDSPEIKLDGDQVLIGPFSSADDAYAAVGDEDKDIDLVGPDDSGANGDDEFPLNDIEGLSSDALPMEARRAKVAKLRESVRKRIAKEAEALDIDTTIGGGNEVSDGGSGNLQDQGAPAVAIQSPQDAGKAHPLDVDATNPPNDEGSVGAVTLNDPMKGGMDKGDDQDLSGAGQGKGSTTLETSRHSVRVGSLVTVQESATGSRVDRGVVAKVEGNKVTLEGDIEYELGQYVVQKIA